MRKTHENNKKQKQKTKEHQEKQIKQTFQGFASLGVAACQLSSPPHKVSKPWNIGISRPWILKPSNVMICSLKLWPPLVWKCQSLKVSLVVFSPNWHPWIFFTFTIFGTTDTFITYTISMMSFYSMKHTIRSHVISICLLYTSPSPRD